MLSTTNDNSNIPFNENKQPYSFAAEPRGIENRRRNSDGANEPREVGTVNIMYDRRIHRGNTYAAPATGAGTADPLELQKIQDRKRRIRAKRRAENRRIVKTPEPVSGRKNIDIQTDMYLEELSDKVPEAIAITQTDAFLDRAPTPLFVPQKSGQDIATQIYDNELFHFDGEVLPVLDVIVGKTLEQALMEVNEENELEVIRAHHRRFEEMRNAEYTEIQRLEDVERRRTEEKDRRIREQITLQKEKTDALEKIAARAFAQSYLHSIIPDTLEKLTNNGYFVEHIEKELETVLMPWLSDEVEKSIKRQKVARLMVDYMIMSAITRK